MRLHVTAPLFGHGVIVGPAPWFKIVRSSLCMGPVEAPVGRLENHQWIIHGRFFTAFHLDEASTVHFEAAAGAASVSHGPFDEVKVADGTVFADDRAIALFDDAIGEWKSAFDGGAWPVVVVVAVRT
ncbi:MAG TPA: hypothetical protein VFE23_20665 [Usitatibacter sp.]|jgi:hypothetical protein|nr:hypothetical protein [Usitatibacter sp.]